jgi:hypothetical protein
MSAHPKAGAHPCALDARNHYPQIKHHTPPPKWSDNTPTPHTGGPAITPGFLERTKG